MSLYRHSKTHGASSREEQGKVMPRRSLPIPEDGESPSEEQGETIPRRSSAIPEYGASSNEEQGVMMPRRSSAIPEYGASSNEEQGMTMPRRSSDITDNSSLIFYQVMVKTGDHKHAGIDNIVSIKIVGDRGETKLLRLNHILKDDFERGITDKFKIKWKDLGHIEYIGIEMRSRRMINKHTSSAWYVDYISVGKLLYHNNTTLSAITFPIYSWIKRDEDIRYFFTNKTCIPHKESEVRRKRNLRVKQTMKNSVFWIDEKKKLSPEFPGYIDVSCEDDLELNLQFTDEMDRCFNRNRERALKESKYKLVKRMFSHFEDFEDYKEVASRLRDHDDCIWLDDVDIVDEDMNPLEDPSTTHWTHDVEFGRQMLNGINPGIIERCRRLPENFTLTNSDVEGLLNKGRTLDGEMKRGHIYIIDHRILQGISTGIYPPNAKDGVPLELAVPICLLYHDTFMNELRPIAIQLQQFSDDSPIPIWTPNDYNPSENVYDWLLAKMWFRHADLQVHQMKSHLSYTHLLVEPIAIATFRCLPPVHPIHKLLRGHLQFVVAINVIGRNSLIGKVSLKLYFTTTYY